MDPGPPLTFDFVYEVGMTKPSRATFTVEWGYELHTITLTARNWSKVRRGKPLRLRGTGYRYEGDFFWDYWTFNQETVGELFVDYGDDGGQGWIGTWGSALEELETYKTPR